MLGCSLRFPRYFYLLFIFLSNIGLSYSPSYATTTTFNLEIANSADNQSELKQSEISPQIVGLFIDNQDFGNQSLILLDDVWYLPLKALNRHAGLRVSSLARLEFITPYGAVNFSKSQTLTIDDALFISAKALRERLFFQVSFNASQYAIHIFLPWTVTSSRLKNDTEITPDITPSLVNLRQIQAQNTIEQQNGLMQSHSSVRFSGNAGPGIWELEYNKPDHQDGALNVYRWASGHDYDQWLIGFDQISPNSLISAIPFSGLQYAWSNKPLSSSAQRSLDIDNFYDRIGSANRAIRGKSQPGMIAQLIVNDQLVEEQRTNLEGQFNFQNTLLAVQNFSIIEVVILNRQRTRILDRFDFSQQSNQSLLKAGQHMIYTGLGLNGNALQDNTNFSSQTDVGLLLYRYGVAEHLSLEASTFNNSTDQFNSIGFSTVLGRRMELNARYAQRENASAFELNSSANGKRWRFRHRSRSFDNDFRAATTLLTSLPRTYEHNAQLDWLIDPNFTLSTFGLDRQSDTEHIQYLLPGFTWYKKFWSISVEPDNHKEYHLKTRYRRKKLFLQYDYLTDVHFLNADYHLSPTLNLFTNFRYEKEDADLYESGFVWYPDSAYDYRSSLSASALFNEQGNSGFRVVWEKSLFPGIYARLEASQNPSNYTINSSDSQRFLLELSADFAYVNKRIVPGDSQSAFLNSGSLAGEIDFGTLSLDAVNEVKKIAIQVDGLRQVVPLRGRTFFIDNIEIGIHRVRLDSRFLPIELSPAANQNYWVKISPGSVSYLNFDLQLLLGFAGRVISPNGDIMPNVRVNAYNAQNDLVISTSSDQFGLYRLDSLPPGKYTLTVTLPSGLEVFEAGYVSLKSSYQFDQDIHLRNEKLNNKDMDQAN